MAADREHAPTSDVPLPPRLPRWLALALSTAIVACVLGTISSIVPSMAFRSKSGVIMYKYGLSVIVAPALFATTVILAARALRPSRKRLMLAALTMLGAATLLFGIKLAREPWFDIDDQFVLLAPWAIHAFVICTFVLLGAGVAVLIYARRLAVDVDIAAAHARIARNEPAPPDS